jgi:hypothetical protein
VVIIPFQIVVDVLFLNMKEWYLRIPIHDYLDYIRFRFYSRKARWKGYEPFKNRSIKRELQSLDQLCFSSQFYFVMTIYVSGMSQIILGLQCQLWTEGYNNLGDMATIPLSMLILLLCFFLD